MKESKIICCDLDDTISDTAGTMVKYADIYHNTILKRNNGICKNVQSTDYFYFTKMYCWSEKETIGFFQSYYPNYLEEVKCKPFAKEVLTLLHKAGYYIHIISARREVENDNVYKLTEKWLHENGIIYDKLLINMPQKAEYVSRCNANIFIDDSFDNCIEVVKSTKCEKTFLMTTSYNKYFSNSAVVRIDNWKHFYSIIN